MRLGILSLILERHPLPPPLLLLLLLPPLSLPPPGCQPPLAMLRRPDMFFFFVLVGLLQVKFVQSRLNSISHHRMPRLRQAPMRFQILIYQGLYNKTRHSTVSEPWLSKRSCHMQFVSGDISNRQCQLQDAALPSAFRLPIILLPPLLLGDHTHLPQRW